MKTKVTTYPATHMSYVNRAEFDVTEEEWAALTAILPLEKLVGWTLQSVEREDRIREYRPVFTKVDETKYAPVGDNLSLYAQERDYL